MFLRKTTYILEVKMRNQRGFTLVELMVVVVIVALLAALLIPMLTARIEAAKWSEGKSGAGTIATALRAYVIELVELEGGTATGFTDITRFMNPSDLHGKYFDIDDYALTNVTYTPNETTPGGYVITYTITVSKPTEQDWEKLGYTLDHTGIWTEVSSGGSGE